jgi:hypothetical protein
MLTKMTDADWITVLRVFEAVRSRRGDKGRDDRKLSLGEGDETALNSRRQINPTKAPQDDPEARQVGEAARAIANLREKLDRQTRELNESRAQQAATSEVLNVISSSQGELAPVFQAILENATRICEASFGSMALREGDKLRRVAAHNAPPEYVAFIKNSPFF